jgi:NAD(P)-dependent dehydrogenase (short-subunit alcohol dehydrogenase family)
MSHNEFEFSRRTLIVGGLAGIWGLTGLRAGAQPGAAAVDMSGKTVLVTGSTDGLGREVAARLGALGATVIVHGRNRERGSEVVRRIEAGDRGSAVFYRADFASLEEVRELAGAVLANHDRLDLLINNAGIWTDGTDVRRTSEDGHELVFAVNYLAGYLLTHRLLPLIERSAPARIVNVSSRAQQAIDFDDVMLTRGFSARRAYAQSKLAQVLFTIDLAQDLAGTGVTVNSLHPASLMDTTMVQLAGATPRSTVDEGADAVMQLAVSPALDGRSGLFFSGLEESRADPQAYDDSARAQLRALSAELTGAGTGEAA